MAQYYQPFLKADYLEVANQELNLDKAMHSYQEKYDWGWSSIVRVH